MDSSGSGGLSYNKDEITNFINKFNSSKFAECEKLYDAVRLMGTIPAISNFYDAFVYEVSLATYDAFWTNIAQEKVSAELFSLVPIYIKRLVQEYFFDSTSEKIKIIVSKINSLTDQSRKYTYGKILLESFLTTIADESFLADIGYDLFSLLEVMLCFLNIVKKINKDDSYNDAIVVLKGLIAKSSSFSGMFFEKRKFKSIFLHVKLCVPLDYKYDFFDFASSLINSDMRKMRSYSSDEYDDYFKEIIVSYSNTWHDIMSFLFDKLEKDNPNTDEYQKVYQCRGQIMQIGFAMWMEFKNHGRQLETCRSYPHNARLFSYHSIPVPVLSTNRDIAENFVMGLNFLRIMMRNDMLKTFGMTDIFNMSKYTGYINEIMESLLSQEHRPNAAKFKRKSVLSIELLDTNKDFIVYLVETFASYFVAEGNYEKSRSRLKYLEILQATCVVVNLAKGYEIKSIKESVSLHNLYNTLKHHISCFLSHHDTSHIDNTIISAILDIHNALFPGQDFDTKILLPQKGEDARIFFDLCDYPVLLIYIKTILHIGYVSKRFDQIKERFADQFYPFLIEKFSRYDFNEDMCLKFSAVIKAISIDDNFPEELDPSTVIFNVVDIETSNTHYYNDLAKKVNEKYIAGLKDINDYEKVRSLLGFMIMCFKHIKIDSIFLQETILPLLNVIGSQDSEENLIIISSIIVFCISSILNKARVKDSDFDSIYSVTKKSQEGLLFGYLPVINAENVSMLDNLKYIDHALDGLHNFMRVIVRLSKGHESKIELIRYLAINFNTLNMLLTNRYDNIIKNIGSSENHYLNDIPSLVVPLVKNRLLPDQVHYAITEYYNLHRNNPHAYPALADLHDETTKICNFVKFDYDKDAVRLCFSADGESWYYINISDLNASEIEDVITPSKFLLSLPSKKSKTTKVIILGYNESSQYKYDVRELPHFSIGSEITETNAIILEETPLAEQLNFLIRAKKRQKARSNELWSRVFQGLQELTVLDKDVLKHVLNPDSGFTIIAPDKLYSLNDVQEKLLSLFSPDTICLRSIFQYLQVCAIFDVNQIKKVEEYFAGITKKNDFWLNLVYQVCIKKSSKQACFIVLNRIKAKDFTRSEEDAIKDIMGLMLKSGEFSDELKNIFKLAVARFSTHKVSGGMKAQKMFSDIQSYTNWAFKNKSALDNILLRSKSSELSDLSYITLESHLSYMALIDLIDGSDDPEAFIILWQSFLRNDEYLSGFICSNFQAFFEDDIECYFDSPGHVEIKFSDLSDVVTLREGKNYNDSKQILYAARQELKLKKAESIASKNRCDGLLEKFHNYYILDSSEIIFMKNINTNVINDMLKAASKESLACMSLQKTFNLWTTFHKNIDLFVESDIFHESMGLLESKRNSMLSELSSLHDILDLFNKNNDHEFSEFLLTIIAGLSSNDFFNSWSLADSLISARSDEGLFIACVKVVLGAYGGKVSQCYIDKIRAMSGDIIALHNLSVRYSCDTISFIYKKNVFGNITKNDDVLGKIKSFRLKSLHIKVTDSNMAKFIDCHINDYILSLQPLPFLASYGLSAEAKEIIVDSPECITSFNSYMTNLADSIKSHALLRLYWVGILPYTHLNLIAELSDVKITNGLAWLLDSLANGAGLESLKIAIDEIKTITVVPTCKNYTDLIAILEKNGFHRVSSGSQPCEFYSNSTEKLGFRIKRGDDIDFIESACHEFTLVKKPGGVIFERSSAKNISRGVLSREKISIIERLDKVDIVYALLRIKKWVGRVFSDDLNFRMQESIASLGLNPLISQQIKNIKLTNAVQQRDFEDIKRFMP